MEIKDDIVFFESDDEFTNFCIAPIAQIKRSEKGTLYCGGDYSDMYKTFVEEGKTFIIKDEDSQVYKHQCVAKRLPVYNEGTYIGRATLVQLDVQGLEEYYEDDKGE
jgi:hypothetical protein